MKNANNYIALIEHRVAGIPCLIGVKNFYRQSPQGPSADSDWDCYGYYEWDGDILDRKGYIAPWLQRKVDDNEESRIDDAVDEYFS